MKKKRNWLCLLVTLLILMVSSTAALGGEIGEDEGDKTLSPYFFVEGADASAHSFPLKGTKVSANINGVIADTYVTQTYANEGSSPINANYVFPASTRVAVHGMKMQIGDTVITAKIKEKEEAKEEFEEAKSQGKSASLLEQQRPNVFTMNVANIMPGDTVSIELHYTEMIVCTEGVYEFVFPTVVGPRYASPSGDSSPEADQWVASPYLKDGATPPGTYDISVNLSTGVPITDLSSSSHEIKVTREGGSQAAVTLANPQDFAGNRDFILDYKLTGQDISCGLMLHTAMSNTALPNTALPNTALPNTAGARNKTENFFMLMVQPPERVKLEDIPPRDYVFVLDVSGSMSGYPLDTAKELIRSLVLNLRESDTFNLVLFSDTSLRMSPKSIPANDEGVRRAFDLIDRQDGGGGTELAPALIDALSLPVDEHVSRSIVIITDGYMSDEGSIFDIINKNMGAASFFPFGIGSSVNRHLMDGIAKTGQGESFVVTDPAEASEAADRFRTYIQAPVLTDLRVDYDGFDVYDTVPATLPTLFAQRPIVLFGKWRGEPSGSIRLSGKAGNQDYTQEIQVSGTKPSESNNAIPYLWARTRVEQLTDYNTNYDTDYNAGYCADSSTGENSQDAVKKEVTQIGLDYSMMTPYTSFIAVTDTVRNKDGNAADVDQPLPLPLHVSNLAVGGCTIGSEPGDLILVLMTASIIVTGVLLRRRRRGCGDGVSLWRRGVAVGRRRCCGEEG